MEDQSSKPEGWHGQTGLSVDLKSYIGIPYKDKGRDREGLDCWGLLRLVYREQLGIELPSYADGYSTAEDQADVARLILDVRDRVPPGDVRPWRPVEKEKGGDAVLIRIAGEPMHVGVVVKPGEMIHVMRGIDVSLERYHLARWNKRILGFYRISNDKYPMINAQ